MRIHTPHVLAAGALTVALTGVATTPARAVPAPDGTSNVLAVVGSRLTEDVMGALAAGYNANAAYNPDPDLVANVPTSPDVPYVVPGQGSCEERTYGDGGVAAPADSDEGKAALGESDNVTTSCVDIVRSTFGRSFNEPSTFQYFAYALDAVTLAHFQGSAAPASLSVDEIRKIYNCTYTNWSQVGGANAPIHRYIPQNGSETRVHFVEGVLGGVEPSTACGPVTQVQENVGSAVPAADRFNAILPYLLSQWIAQGNGVVPDERGGTVIGPQEVGLSAENPVAGPDVNGRYSPNPDVITEFADFVGVFPDYNITDSRLPDYGQALRFIGTDDDGDGYLCDGNSEVTDTLTTYGFQPFDAGLSGSHCRVS